MDGEPSLSSWLERPPDETSLLPSDGGQDEFTKFLDLDLDLDFSGLDNANNASTQASSSGQMPATTMMQDVQLTGAEHVHQNQHSGYPTHQHNNNGQNQQQQQQLSAVDMQGTNGPAQHHQQQPMGGHFYHQKQQQQHGVQHTKYGHPQSFIPPTPNSIEMQGRVPNNALHVDTDNQRAYEYYSRPPDDQTAFTPAMSPAMTPLEQQYRLPEYTVPGEYFTPLTSPALEGHTPNQNQAPNNGGGFLYNNVSQADLSFVSSPMDMPSHLTSASVPASPAITRNSRRRQSLQSSRTGTGLLRQSPSVRPANSRQKSKTPKVQPAPASRTQQMQQQDTKTGGLAKPTSSNEGSGQDSVSPEPLMPPPAMPRSGKSPYITAQEAQGSKSAEAATPATLMKLQNQNAGEHSPAPFPRSGGLGISNSRDEVMDDISLPEPTISGDQTPVLSAQPNSIPTPIDRPGTAGSSVGPSPQIGAMQSPAGPVGLKRTDSKQSGRNAKKRQSTAGSAQVSPALRPRLSPRIEPSIKNNEGVSSETSAQYLASKSNYQRILERTVLPGLSYPESLAKNLSSKRDNHKLAEQGRRNRINTALKEIETLLPPFLLDQERAKDSKDKEHKDSNGGANGTNKSPDKPTPAQPISKASTVEMAIVYIKALQQELVDTQDRLKKAEGKLDGKSSPPPAPPPQESSQTAKVESSPTEADKEGTAAKNKTKTDSSSQEATETTQTAVKG